MGRVDDEHYRLRDKLYIPESPDFPPKEENPRISPLQIQEEINTILALCADMDQSTADQLRLHLEELRARYTKTNDDKVQTALIKLTLDRLFSRLVGEFENRTNATYFPWRLSPEYPISTDKKWQMSQISPSTKLERIASLHHLWLTDKPLSAKIGIQDEEVIFDASGKTPKGYTGFTLITFPYASTQILGMEREISDHPQRRFFFEPEPRGEVKLQFKAKPGTTIVGFSVMRQPNPNKCGKAEFIDPKLYREATPDNVWPDTEPGY